MNVEYKYTYKGIQSIYLFINAHKQIKNLIFCTPSK